METGFFNKVYDMVKMIPVGKVATYGQIATKIGEPSKARIVGWALHQNPFPYKVPCHRVVNRKGELSGSFAFGGEFAQRELLEKEGIKFSDNLTVDISSCLWESN